MKVGIVGFPRAGKTTIFNALTGLHAAVGGYAEAGKANMGAIKVPDARVARLSEIYRPRKTTYAEIVFVDFARAPGDQDKTVLPAVAVAQMREVEAFALVLRGFTDPLGGDVAAPEKEMAAFETELILADLAVIEKRLERLRKERGKEREQQLLERAAAALESERSLRTLAWAPEESAPMAGFGFLSRKPVLAVLNVGEGAAGAPLPASLQAALGAAGIQGLVLAGKIEMEIAQLDEEDRAAFFADLGVTASARDRFVQAAYALLNQITFLTVGKDEVRAWPVRRGTLAIKAAGKVHSDMERGFIRAEVTHFEDLVRYGGEAKCREAGKTRLEGKDYEIQDGDIVHFRFNV